MQVLGCSAQTGNGTNAHRRHFPSSAIDNEEVIEREWGGGEVCSRPTRQSCTQPTYVRGLGSSFQFCCDRPMRRRGSALVETTQWHVIATPIMYIDVHRAWSLSTKYESDALCRSLISSARFCAHMTGIGILCSLTFCCFRNYKKKKIPGLCFRVYSSGPLLVGLGRRLLQLQPRPLSF